MPIEVKILWENLYIDHGNAEISPRFINETPPEWWLIAYKLLVIADEACEGIAFLDTSETASSSDTWIERFFRVAYFQRLSKEPNDNDARHQRIVGGPATLALLADPDVVCVQFKARTPSVGCTTRVLSRNLALLPPHGVVRSKWQPSQARGRTNDVGAMNLLLIPFPYSISATAFKGHPVSPLREAGGKDNMFKTAWGWFDIENTWIPTEKVDDFCNFVCALIHEANADVGKVHGIILPELALTWHAYNQLVQRIRDEVDFEGVEFLIAGSRDNCNTNIGNFVLTTEFFVDDQGKRSAISVSRAKHHRWKLDKSQIETYSLASSLDPRMWWWERMNILNRQIHINVFRQDSVYTVMICEDLARSDPCHETLRSLGPNLIFVLLMDGPQIVSRWPSRYATALADDPGSSVLTVTSLALIRRANRTRIRDASWSIGLWKDDSGITREIECPADHHAVILTLSGSRVTDQTLCGRNSEKSRAWRFHHQQAIKLPPSQFGFS